MPLLSTLSAVVPAAINGVKKVVNWVKDKKVGQGIAKIAPTVAQTAASIMTNKTNRKYAEKQYNANMAAFDEQWNKQNAYNSPQAQMQRYKEAGLNPHLIYGQGSPGLAANVSTPQMNYEAVNPMNFGNVQNSMMYSSKISQIDAATENYRSMIQLRSLDIKYLDKSMDDRLNLIKSNLMRGVLSQNHMWHALKKLEYENGKSVWYYSENPTQSVEMTLTDDKSPFMKSVDATLNRLYESNEAVSLDNWTRQWENELRKLGINPNSTNKFDVAARYMYQNVIKKIMEE